MATRSTYTDDEDKDDLSVYTTEEKLEKKEVESTLRPADHGSHAWLFLCSSFLIEGLALGMPHSPRSLIDIIFSL